MVIAERDKNEGMVFIVAFVSGLALIAISLFYFNMMLIILGAAWSLFYAGMLIDFFLTPKKAITLDGDRLIFTRGGEVCLTEITGVESGGGFLQRSGMSFGTVTVKIGEKVMKCRHIADCRGVADNIQKLIAQAKQ